MGRRERVDYNLSCGDLARLRTEFQRADQLFPDDRAQADDFVWWRMQNRPELARLFFTLGASAVRAGDLK